MLAIWGMRSIPSLPLHPGPLWPEVVAPDGSNINKLCTYAKLNCLKCVLTFKLHPYAKLNCLKQNCF